MFEINLKLIQLQIFLLIAAVYLAYNYPHENNGFVKFEHNIIYYLPRNIKMFLFLYTLTKHSREETDLSNKMHIRVKYSANLQLEINTLKN